MGIIDYCPGTDGTIKGCIANCNCVYAGNQSAITTCTGICNSNGGQVGVGVDTQAVQQSLVAALVSAIVTPIEQNLPGILERVGLFAFALVIVGGGIWILGSSIGGGGEKEETVTTSDVKTIKPSREELALRRKSLKSYQETGRHTDARLRK